MSWRVDSRSAWEARGAVCVTAPTAGALRRRPLPVRDLDSVLKVGMLIVKQLSHKAKRKAKTMVARDGAQTCYLGKSCSLLRQISKQKSIHLSDKRKALCMSPEVV